MSYKESAHKNLLMGVSQQAPQDRLPGQLSQQINMLSDPVTGLRRRPGTEYVQLLKRIDLAGQPKPKVYHTDINGKSVIIMIFVHTGEMSVFEDATGTLLRNFPANPYLATAAATNLQLVTMGDDVFIANTTVKPTLTAPAAAKDPKRFGYFYVPAGQYSKEFSITITNRVTGDVYTVSYQTPSGAGTNDAAKTSVHAIAWQLFGKIWGREEQMNPLDPLQPDPSRPRVVVDPALLPVRDATVNKGIDMGYVAFELEAGWDVTVTSNTGTGFMRTSGDMTVRSSDELPATLPTTADYPATSGGVAFMNGVIVGAGTSRSLTYFRWDSNAGRWIEDAAYGANYTLGNMPLRMTWVGTSWTLAMPTYPPRAAGDADTNPDFNFLKTPGITGMTTFQGRLVLLSNEYCCMSASDDPLRWYKRSAAALEDSDPVEVAAQGTLTAPYVYGVTYNKDLVLFSHRYQAVVPGGGVITPRTATLSVTTTYEVDITALPVAAGRSLYFAAPRSLGYVGIHEMLPSPSTDSHYIADDVTAHIPSYIQGTTNFMAGASTSGYLVTSANAGPDDELTVYQYIWAGSEKIQEAWHRWTLTRTVLGAYFSGDQLMLIQYDNLGRVLLCRLNLRALSGAAGLPSPRYDMQRLVTCTVAGQLQVDTDYWADIKFRPRVYRISPGVGQYLERSLIVADEQPGTTTLTVPEAEVGTQYIIGHAFTSLVEPSPPVVRDYNGVPVTSTRATLRGYRVSYKDTGEFQYRVGDAVRPGQWIDTTPLRLFSRRLDAGQPFVDTAVVPLPARVDMLTSSLELRASGPYDMNISTLEYGYRHNMRYGRA